MAERGQRVKDAAEKLSMVRLALVPGVGPRTQRALLARFGSSRAVLAAPISELLAVDGVGGKLSAAIRNAPADEAVERELRLCDGHSIEVLIESDSGYPAQLREIYDPPAVLYRRGSWQPSDAFGVAVVGTRHATQYGRRQAERLAAGLARAGLTIVSGLARGIDAAAHRAALSAGGRTVAVLASGLLNVYPSEHAELAYDITRSGAVISEVPPKSSPQPGGFPQRNRLISGLSLGVLVVEAPHRSGALITAEQALEQGREVFAVPGPIDSPATRGCHRLLKEGAKLVESVEDVLEELGQHFQAANPAAERPERHPAEMQLNERERAVFHAIDVQPTSIDQIVEASRLPVAGVLATISALEMRHLVRRLTGSSVSRV